MVFPYISFTISKWYKEGGERREEKNLQQKSNFISHQNKI
jgi:hypothetical protein